MNRMAPVRVQVALAVLAETQPMCMHAEVGEDRHLRSAWTAACQVLRHYLYGEQDYEDTGRSKAKAPARRRRKRAAPPGGETAEAVT